MTGERFPKAKYRRQLAHMEEELRGWAYVYARSAQESTSEWVERRFLDRYEQLLDVAHTIERARNDLDVLPRLS